MLIPAKATRYLALLAAAVLLAALCMIWGCSSSGTRETGPDAVLEVVPPDEWPVLADDMDAFSLHQACQESLEFLRRMPPDKVFHFGNRKITAADLLVGMERLSGVLLAYPDPRERTEALKKQFVLLRSIGSDGQGGVLFTGYYEPVMEARRQLVDDFVYPVYGLPEDIVVCRLQDFRDDLPDRKLVGRVKEGRFVPYHDREEIDFEGRLSGKAKVLGWVRDPVGLFFLHIQGSGQLHFADGGALRVGYVASNGHPYVSIGRYLLDQGLMLPEEMSMQGIRAYLQDNPEQMRGVLTHNPSYVFFRELDTGGGPLGCYEIPLTGGRSIATDRRLFNAPAMAYIQTEIPAVDGSGVPISRFVLNQDTGGAIRGAGRVDLYFGSGSVAGHMAGRMKYQGRLYFLLPRPERKEQ